MFWLVTSGLTSPIFLLKTVQNLECCNLGNVVFVNTFRTTAYMDKCPNPKHKF